MCVCFDLHSQIATDGTAKLWDVSRNTTPHLLSSYKGLPEVSSGACITQLNCTSPKPQTLLFCATQNVISVCTFDLTNIRDDHDSSDVSGTEVVKDAPSFQLRDESTKETFLKPRLRVNCALMQPMRRVILLGTDAGNVRICS